MHAGNMSNRTITACVRERIRQGQTTLTPPAQCLAPPPPGQPPWGKSAVFCAKKKDKTKSRSRVRSDECPSEEERSPNGAELAMADIRAFFMG